MVSLHFTPRLLLTAAILLLACMPAGWCCVVKPCRGTCASPTGTAMKAETKSTACHCRLAADQTPVPRAPHTPCKTCKCQPALHAGLAADQDSALANPVSWVSLTLALELFGTASPPVRPEMIMGEGPPGLAHLRRVCRWNC